MPPDPRFVIENFEPRYLETRRRGELSPTASPAAERVAREAELWRFDARAA